MSQVKQTTTPAPNPAKTGTLVAVSALALLALPAYGQTVNINCPQQMGFGQHIACANGSLRINPDGSTSLSGCLVQQVAPQPASCKLVITGGVGTRNVKVSFATSSINVKMGADTATFRKLRMQERGQPTTAAFFVFNPLDLTSSITLDIGGTLDFS